MKLIILGWLISITPTTKKYGKKKYNVSSGWNPRWNRPLTEFEAREWNADRSHESLRRAGTPDEFKMYQQFIKDNPTFLEDQRREEEAWIKEVEDISIWLTR